VKQILFVGAVVLSFIFVKAWFDSHSAAPDTSDITLKIVPGRTLRVEVPEAFADGSEKKTFEMRIPDEYTPDKPVPLLVWFAPGGGSDRVGSIPPIVDFKKFLLVALPYPGNNLPRLAIKAGIDRIDRFWAYERPMLQWMQMLVPNISDRVRIAAGFSSGAHLIGSGLDRNWAGFTDFFTAYVLHEGGYAPEMTYHGMRNEHKVLVTYGLQNNSYGKVVVRKMKKAHKHPDVRRLPHTGHDMSQEAIETIRNWIIETELP